MPRRAGTSEHGVPLRLAEASPSEPPQTSAAAASDTPTGERRYVSMTEEVPSGNYRTTLQRDHRERWMPTKEERTMTNEKAREAKRNFYIGESKELGPSSIASAEASPLHGEFYLSRRNVDEVQWNHHSADEQTQARDLSCAGKGQTQVTRPRPDGACTASRTPTSTRSSVPVQCKICRPSTLHLCRRRESFHAW